MTSTSHAAATAVLNTNELLELILTHLPIRDLARSQRVCRLFLGLTLTSPILQTKLFHRPAPANAHLQWAWSPQVGDYENWEPTYLTTSPTPTDIADAATNGISIEPIGVLHPALDEGRTPYGLSHTIETKFDWNRMRTWACNDGNWREMHVTQPPSTEISVSYKKRHETPIDSDSKIMLEDPTGIRLGAILDKTLELLQHWSDWPAVRVAERENGEDVQAPNPPWCDEPCCEKPAVYHDVYILVYGSIQNTSPYIAQARAMSVRELLRQEEAVAPRDWQKMMDALRSGKSKA